MSQTNRYKQLFSFTLILGIGTVISKLMTYVVLTPLYTHYLTTDEFGIVELVVQTANMLMPLVSLGINQAVLRFGMDGETDRGSVLTTGLAVNLLGFIVFLLFYPLIRLIPAFGEYALLVYIFVFCAITHYLFAYCIKSMHRAKLFTVCVIIGTAITVVLDILFLAVLDMGIVGYILAIALSDLTCSVILIIRGKLYKIIRFSKLKKSITTAMLRYSIPLIPNSALWWITDYSDRYMVTLFVSESANGLYSLAYRLPNMLIMVCGIFMDAWQMSVLGEKSRLERQKFFTNVFAMYQSIIFVGASALIAGAKLVTRIIAADSFFDSWQYIPTLVVATAMSCFVTFLGTIYVVEKKSKSSLVTTVIGTVANIGANLSWPVIVLGYNVPISLGHINLANYSKVRIQYGCDGGAGTQAFFNKLNGNAPIGLKSNGSSYGHAGSYVMDGDIAHADMTFSIADLYIEDIPSYADKPAAKDLIYYTKIGDLKDEI